MEEALEEFHKNKDIFVAKGVCEHFNIPKLHAMMHYAMSITQEGTADGYNTELPERLHIDLAKDPYQSSNRRDYIEQMTWYLYRMETVDAYISFLNWAEPHYNCEDSGLQLTDNFFDDNSDSDNDEEPDNNQADEFNSKCGCIILPKCVLYKSITLNVLEQRYGAKHFLHCLTEFLMKELPQNMYKDPLSTDKYGVFR